MKKLKIKIFQLNKFNRLLKIEQIFKMKYKNMIK